MTPDQFKAWFEGFCEAVNDAPTPEQWAKIKAKVADLREKPLVTLRDDFKRYYAAGDQSYQPPLIAGGLSEVETKAIIAASAGPVSAAIALVEREAAEAPIISRGTTGRPFGVKSRADAIAEQEQRDEIEAGINAQHARNRVGLV